MSEREYDGTGTGHEPYGAPAYRGPGSVGDEVAAALAADLAQEYGADPTWQPPAHEGHRADVVGRLVEDDGGSVSHLDSDLLASSAEDEGDLSAEEAGMHFIDPDHDDIPE